MGIPRDSDKDVVVGSEADVSRDTLLSGVSPARLMLPIASVGSVVLELE